VNKILFVILLLVIPLFAKNQATCNTVQLLSAPSSHKQNLLQKSYPQDCRVMQIGKTATVRCGCFSGLDGAKERLEELKQKYKNASLASTYRYRFSQKQIGNANADKKSTSLKRAQKKIKTKQQNNRSCYSVSIASVIKSQKNLDSLYKQNYPNDCKVMEFSKSFGVRCGCFDTLDEAEKRRIELQQKFKRTTLKQTYRYRFEPDYFVSRVYQDSHKKISNNESELRLLLQVFLYKGDLENAYKVANIGYKAYPNSYYWNQKMADIWFNALQNVIKNINTKNIIPIIATSILL